MKSKLKRRHGKLKVQIAGKVLKHMRTYTNTRASIAKVSKCSTLSDFVSLFGAGMYQNDQEKKHTAMLKLWNKVCKTQQVLSKSSKFQLPITHCLTILTISTRLRPESPKGRYVLLCWTILFNRLASVGSLW